MTFAGGTEEWDLAGLLAHEAGASEPAHLPHRAASAAQAMAAPHDADDAVEYAL